MMRTFVGGVLTEFWDSDARTYTRYEGGEAVESRPFTDEENAEADTAAALEALAALRREFEREIALLVAPQVLAKMQRLTLSLEGAVEGGPWRQPNDPESAYPKGYVVSHGGVLWASEVDANMSVPPTDWREVPPEVG